ncbi:MAG: Conserved putative rane protein [Actinomycetia bacterium]|nr:Conserved putative rane protein [Actinomycetes bacterium]
MTEVLAGERVVSAVRPDAEPATRGRRQSPLLRIGGELDTRWRVGLSAAGVALVLVAWSLAAARANDAALFPTPLAAARALGDMWSDGALRSDLWASSHRILIGYGMSVAFGAVFGILIGSFPSVEAFFEAQIGFLRYIPAAALSPVFLLWLGIGESPKVWLIVVGTVFFNILMIADVARAVPRELINAAYTLGAGRWTVLRRVIARFSVPGIVDAARVNLAAAWLMLVVAEILAADHGLAISIIKLQRFRAVDGMFALLFTFGVIGLVSDLFLRFLRNRLAPWAKS